MTLPASKSSVNSVHKTPQGADIWPSAWYLLIGGEVWASMWYYDMYFDLLTDIIWEEL